MRISRGVPILTYHRISDPAGLYSVSPADFAKQMALLHRLGIRSRTLSGLAMDGFTGNPQSVVLTFDDAYQDFVDSAFPILSCNGFTATIFAVSARIGDESRWDNPSAPLASGNSLKKLHTAGMEIGSHTRTHPRLRSLDEMELITEIQGSRKELQGILGAPVDSLSYPFGEDSPLVCDIAQRAGYGRAVINHGGHTQDPNDMYRIPRISLSGFDRICDFYTKLVWGVPLRELFIGKARGLKRRVALRLEGSPCR